MAADKPFVLDHDPDEPQQNAKRRWVTVVSFALWIAIIAWQAGQVFSEPSFLNIVSLLVLVVLFFAVNAQIFLIRWSGNQNWRRLLARLHGSAYISDFNAMPNRNYLLAELRREMPRARMANKPFVLLVVSIETIDEIRRRRGNDFADRSVRAMADVLQRITRKSDFVAHVGEGRFCTLLNECSYEQSFIYLARLPGHIGVSDGRQVYDVPISVRVHAYDMESIYATDVLREAEDIAPLRHQDHKDQHWSQVA